MSVIMCRAPLASRCPSLWRPPALLDLGGNEIHVWRASLKQRAPHVQQLLDTLAADEQARAKRFYFLRDRERSIVARGALRSILGLYLSREPTQLHFCYGSYGKPALVTEAGGNTLRFNVSHSHGLALFAVTRSREVGIDLEYIRPDLDIGPIAERFFSPREVAMLRALPTRIQTEAFFTCWTRKEAYIKARGKGLSLPLDRFSVSLVPGEPAALLGTEEDPRGASRWSLQELILDPGYVAALAVEGQACQLRCWQWAWTEPRDSSTVESAGQVI